MSEHLSDSRLRPGPAPVPVLVDERADAGLDTRAACELDGVLDVPKPPEDQDILGPVDPGAVCNRGAPSGETTLDGHPASALEPLRRILAVSPMRASAMAWMRLVFAVMSRSRVKPCSVSPRWLSPSPFDAPCVPSPRLRTATQRPHAARCGTKTFRSVGVQERRQRDAGRQARGTKRPSGPAAGPVVTAKRRTERERAGLLRYYPQYGGDRSGVFRDQAVPTTWRRDRRQERKSMRWRWNRFGLGMLTGPVTRRTSTR